MKLLNLHHQNQNKNQDQDLGINNKDLSKLANLNLNKVIKTEIVNKDKGIWEVLMTLKENSLCQKNTNAGRKWSESSDDVDKNGDKIGVSINKGG